MHVYKLFLTGMIIEAMAGKSACLNGKSQDASPFKFDEKNAAADYLGKLLVDCMPQLTIFINYQPSYEGHCRFGT